MEEGSKVGSKGISPSCFLHGLPRTFQASYFRKKEEIKRTKGTERAFSLSPSQQLNPLPPPASTVLSQGIYIQPETDCTPMHVRTKADWPAILPEQFSAASASGLFQEGHAAPKFDQGVTRPEISPFHPFIHACIRASIHSISIS
jgi:hypothetical protein